MATRIEELTARIFGNPTGDPVGDAMRELALKGAARIGEMNESGFDTAALFDHDFLAARVDSAEGAFVLTSRRTGTVYLVTLTTREGDRYRAAVQAYNPKKVGSRFYKMTVVRAADGSIRMNPGW